MEVLQFEDETEQEGWWMVKCANGKQGLVPDNFVELVQSVPGKHEHKNACTCIILAYKLFWQ